MKRGKSGKVELQKDVVVEAAPEDLTPTAADSGAWDGPTRTGEDDELAELAAQSVAAQGEPESMSAEAALEGEAAPEVVEAAPEAETALEAEPAVEGPGRLENILESLLYAADRALTVSDLKRLVNERDAKKVTSALEAVRDRYAPGGIQLVTAGGGWQFRTNPENAPWVSKLIAGRPQRLSRAMLETLAIVAYRQPVTRPEIDEIRGVDCGPVLKTLLERNLVRILGKKEEVGRPMLYGTTPDFLKTFSLRDLSELPTLREFHELSEQQMASVDAQAPLPLGNGAGAPTDSATDSVPASARSPFAPAPLDLAPVDQDEEDDLLEELETATLTATRAAGPPPGATAEAAGAAAEAAGAAGPDRPEAG